MATERTARSVSDVLRRAGVQTGLRYTQTGYVLHDGTAATVEGVMVTRQGRGRYGESEHLPHVEVYCVDPTHPAAEPTPQFVERTAEALRAAGLPVTARRTMFEVHDEEQR